MTQRAMGRRTVPQIFIGGEHVGGFDEIAALDRAGKLDPMLAA
jgi:glutaredoxin 3